MIDEVFEEDSSNLESEGTVLSADENLWETLEIDKDESQERIENKLSFHLQSRRYQFDRTLRDW